jgi:hypothetical protein
VDQDEEDFSLWPEQWKDWTGEGEAVLVISLVGDEAALDAVVIPPCGGGEPGARDGDRP